MWPDTILLDRQTFIVLAGTLSATPSNPVRVMASILRIDRFLSMFGAFIDMIEIGGTTLVLARWEREFDGKAVRQHLPPA